MNISWIIEANLKVNLRLKKAIFILIDMLQNDNFEMEFEEFPY
jgi:hypothetical protein